MSATPGPWKFSQRDDFSYRIEAKQGPLDVTPAVAYGLNDARLIAAAPDLLAALRDLCKTDRNNLNLNDSSQMWRRAHAAISKAEQG